MRYSDVPEEKIDVVAGRNYPGTYREFVEMFPDDVSYIEIDRWVKQFNDGFIDVVLSIGKSVPRSYQMVMPNVFKRIRIINSLLHVRHKLDLMPL